ncbi:ankyrin repeat domain-containing protein [Actinacidiphila glaucinigra]|uniref:ankyrin repeat domain-containing protein n=1 Tax=Actinacidiphila glaucinigra TaxID=235986 RepID=UPI0037B3A79F
MSDNEGQQSVEEEWTPAHRAVELGEYEELARLLAGGVDPDEVCFGQTLLVHAIDLEGDSARQSGKPLNSVLTAILLAYGADPALVDPDGDTPLSMAKMVNHVAAENLLRSFMQGKLEDFRSVRRCRG